MPLFFVSLALTQYNLRYFTPVSSMRDVLFQILMFGSWCSIRERVRAQKMCSNALIMAEASLYSWLWVWAFPRFPDFSEHILVGWFFSHVLEYTIQRGTSSRLFQFVHQPHAKRRGCVKWKDATVILPLALAGISAIAFVLVELFVAPEPVMAPFLLKQKIPVLVGLSNYLVALCNFGVIYFYPMWFQTVALTSASTAGESRSCPVQGLFKKFIAGRIAFDAKLRYVSDAWIFLTSKTLTLAI